MPKLPTLMSQQVIKLLEHRGFVLDHSSGSHRLYYHPLTKRRVTVPFHRGDLPKGTLLSILKQAGIDREQMR